MSLESEVAALAAQNVLLVQAVTALSQTSSTLLGIQASVIASAASAADSANSAVLAAANAGAPKWVSGTSYTAASGQAVWSPATRQVYRCISNVSGTTDPSLDPSHWALLDRLGPTIQTVNAASVTAVAGVHYVLIYTGSLVTVTMPASPAEGTLIWLTFNNGFYTNIINFNNKNHMGKSYITEPTMTIDNDGVTLALRFMNNEWRLI